MYIGGWGVSNVVLGLLFSMAEIFRSNSLGQAAFVNIHNKQQNTSVWVINVDLQDMKPALPLVSLSHVGLCTKLR